jgi:hypothetical protein
VSQQFHCYVYIQRKCNQCVEEKTCALFSAAPFTLGDNPGVHQLMNGLTKHGIQMHNGILFNCKKESNSVICNMDGTGDHCVK